MKRHLIAITTIFLCLMLTASSKVAADRLTVVASVFPLYDFAREVGGPEVDVKLLLPPGVDPHSWEPRPSDMVLLSEADLFIYTGGGMEPWAETFAGSSEKKGAIIVEIMYRLDLMEHHEAGGLEKDHDIEHREGEVHEEDHHGEDPHFWLDLSLAVEAVELISRTMAEKDPGNKDLYIANAEHYASRLRDLDRAYTVGLESCRSRQIVTGGHAAFGHLARRYNLEQVSVYGLSPDSEPSPRHFAGIVKMVKDQDIGTVFSEELMNPRMTEVLSEETGTRIMVLNPAGNLSLEQWRKGITFADIMKNNLVVLREGLKCE